MADELCFSSSSYSYKSKKNPIFQLITCIILHDLSLLCSFIISYPLYFSYFIFFSRYFIKLISFISPLFIATVFLSLLLTTTTAFCPKLPQLELGILQTVIRELKLNLHDDNGDEEDRHVEDFELYKKIFDGTLSIRICNEEVSLTKKIQENSVNGGRRNDVTTSDSDTARLGIEKIPENSICGGWRNDVKTGDSYRDKLGIEKIPENSVHGGRRNKFTASDSDMDKLGVEKIPGNSIRGGRRIDITIIELEEEKGSEKLFEELDRFEDFTTATETKADSAKVIGELRKAGPRPVRKGSSGSEAINSSDNDTFSQSSIRSSSWTSNSSSILSSHGSMREEKEWRRTLACKLFEERHNSRGGEEGMDSLWEAYENDNAKNRKEIMISNNKNKMMIKKNSNNCGIRSFDDDDDDDEDEEMSNRHLCCLQALKLSTGKMNLGMGKPNLVKISKALKGFGWLHHLKNKHDTWQRPFWLDINILLAREP